MMLRIDHIFGVALLLLLCDSAGAKTGATQRKPSDSASSFRVVTYADTGTALQKCKANIRKADSDNNSKLVADEYANFIEIQSGGVIDSDFDDLDTSFILVFQTVACKTCFEATENINCCVGPDAFIPLTLPDSEEEMLMYTFICTQVNNAINAFEPPESPVPTAMPSRNPETAPPTIIPTSRPSVAPTVSLTKAPSTIPPTRTVVPTTVDTEAPTYLPSVATTTVSPTEEPSGKPSIIPTEKPTNSPTGTPTIILTPSPTELPTDVPTVSPTTAPVVSPVVTPTNTPTSAPTVRPTSAPTVTKTSPPTAAPTISLTREPTSVPTISPTREPTSIPTISPTREPTSTPTAKPTMVPTDAPTVPPTLAPTLPPKCVSFGYTLENQAGLTAQDILDGNNNTVKVGLEIATRTTTIQILNETFPKTASLGGRSANDNLLRRHRHRQLELLKSAPRAFEVAAQETFGVEGARKILNTFEDELNTQNRRETNERLLTRLLFPNSRRLVYYTDELPPVVTNVVDNPFCPRGDEDGITLCQLVTTEVCVVLEEGDDPDLVQSALVAGFRDAIQTGEFFQAIPPEHLP